ncbi:hypothetical protein [Paraflavitalea pollutisoli]|uniref:hypothetical protein n=1 Tax=Paraflavitalea pollutisoli TaxID=3034143 RepID=UPI0023EC6C2F|nr:hypothetical protein [Paraflavitalea sp. H1-2-19X]
MKFNTLHGWLLPVMLILLQACSTGKVTSSYHNNGLAPDLMPDKALTASIGPTVYRNNISIRAVRHFKDTYPKAQDERWYIIQNGFMAKFRVDSTNVRTDYDQHGNWLYTIRYLYEKQLPREVRRIVRSNYLDFIVSSAEEIQVNREFIYLLHIHEGKDWRIVRVYNGEMSEITPPGKVN